MKQQTDTIKYASKVCVYTEITMENRNPQVFSELLPSSRKASRVERRVLKKLKDTPIWPKEPVLPSMEIHVPGLF